MVESTKGFPTIERQTWVVNNETATQKATTPDVLQYLNQEINQLLADQKQPGWTVWALLGALATTLWLLSEELGAPSVSVSNSLLLFLVFSISLHILGLLKHMVSQPKTRGMELTGRFQFTHHQFGPTRVTGFVVLAELSLFLWISVRYSEKVSAVHFWAGILYLGTAALLVLFVIVLSYLRLPLPQSSTRNKYEVVPYIFLVITGCLFVFGYASALSTQVPTLNVSDYRVGALLLVTSFLIQKLSGQSTQSPLISSLRDIRRDLVCGRQELKAAIDQIDVALLGLKVHDVLQEEVSTLLKSHSDYRSILRKLNVQTQALASTLPNQPTGEELIVARATLKSIWNDTEGLPPLLSRLREDWKNSKSAPYGLGDFSMRI